MNNENYGLEDEILGSYELELWTAAEKLTKALTCLTWLQEDYPDAMPKLCVPETLLKDARDALCRVHMFYEVTEVDSPEMSEEAVAARRIEWNRMQRNAATDCMDLYESSCLPSTGRPGASAAWRM